ncbi:MAG: sulfur carrier protein ThiS [Acidobacteria bacterium]|nr:sulfur carrier protein ThiS [Acidobacteriota bacterium]
MIEVIVNGEPHRIEAGASLVQLVTQLELTPQRIAVEHNREIVSKPRWADTRLSEGDQLEIVHFVGGG